MNSTISFGHIGRLWLPEKTFVRRVAEVQQPKQFKSQRYSKGVMFTDRELCKDGSSQAVCFCLTLNCLGKKAAVSASFKSSSSLRTDNATFRRGSKKAFNECQNLDTYHHETASMQLGKVCREGCSALSQGDSLMSCTSKKAVKPVWAKQLTRLSW